MKHPSEPAIRLLTLNANSIPFTRNLRARLLTIAREVQQRALDLVCFQEVHLWHYADLLTGALPEFPHRAAARYLYAPKGGLLTLARHHLAGQRFVLFEKRGRLHTPGAADWLLHKGILICEVNRGGVPLTIVNTHLLANYDADWSPHNPYAQHERAELKQLEHALADLSPDRLVIVVGDFNVPTDAPLYRDFVLAAGLIDPLATSDRPTFRPPKFFPPHYTRALDHALVRPPRGQRVAVSAEILLDERLRLVNGAQAHLSDHSAIELQVELG